MCLVALAHRTSSRFPLILAANRDEDHQRPTHDVHRWGEDPEVVGGTDALFGGSWLAVKSGGRFAAVTNLRGAERRSRSRGALVRDFVTGSETPAQYAEGVARHAWEYAGFHLLAGAIGGALMYIAPDHQTPLATGVYAFSNAPRDEVWPKVGIAEEELRRVQSVDDREVLIEELLRFLAASRDTASPESEIFIAGPRYGTRSSSVIVAGASEIVFVEQSYGPEGIAGGRRRFVLSS